MILYAHSRSLEIGRFRRLALLAALLLLLNVFPSRRVIAASTPDMSSTPPMALSQVVDTLVARNAERARDLTSYQGRRIYTLVYHGFPKDLHAMIVVDMQYEAPDTKEFRVVAQSGPKFFVDQVLKRLLKSETDAQRQKIRESVNLDRQNYEFSNLEYEPAADGCSYVLTVEPKHSNKYLYRGKIWVNDKDFAVCRLQAQPAENPSFWIKSTAIAETYEKVGKFWLPEENKSVSRIRVGGTAALTIQYQDYKVQARSVASAHASPTSAAAK